MFRDMGYGTYLFFGMLTLLGAVYVYIIVVSCTLSDRYLLISSLNYDS